MTWRTVVINQRAKLSFKMGHMLVRMQENDMGYILKIYPMSFLIQQKYQLQQLL